MFCEAPQQLTVWSLSKCKTSNFQSDKVIYYCKCQRIIPSLSNILSVSRSIKQYLRETYLQLHPIQVASSVSITPLRRFTNTKRKLMYVYNQQTTHETKLLSSGLSGARRMRTRLFNLPNDASLSIATPRFNSSTETYLFSNYRSRCNRNNILQKIPRFIKLHPHQ